MKAFLSCLFAILLSCGTYASTSIPAPGQPATAKEIAQGYRDRVIIARPKKAETARAEQAETRHRVRVRQKFERLGDLRILELESSDDALAMVARLRESGAYEFVEPDYVRHISVTPNDPSYASGALWALNNTGQSGGIIGVPGADIEALAGWDIRREAPDVVVAVVDTGVNLAHQDIAANLWRNPRGGADLHGANFVGGSGRQVSGNPSDDQGHGTHVAGTIGAVGNNGLGITGVAWNVKIMAVKVLGSTGTGFVSDIVAGINYAVSNGAHIINASFGAEVGAPFSQSELTAVTGARTAGVMVVAAAGNDGANLDISRTYPASFALDNLVTVGNSDRRDQVASSSNYGAAVDLFAPGSEIVSLRHDDNTGTTSKSGTSMAAPHVAGALALVKAQFPGDTYRQLINRLLRGSERGDRFLGRAQTGGRLNLLRALTTANNRPFNDDFSDRPRFTTDNLSIRSNNVGATSEPTDPSIQGLPLGATLWWEWTAPASGLVSVDTSGSGYDTVVGVFTGSTAGALTLVAANDDSISGVTSRLSFNAQGGTSYQIGVAGKNSGTGLTLLNVGTTPANDAFAQAVTLTGESTRVTATNLHSSREAGEPLILGFSGGNSLWYQWTAPRTGRFQVAAVSNDFDPLLAVYTGTAVTALTAVSASDNTGSDNAQTGALCTIDATVGTTYRITVDSKTASAEGQFTLTIVDSRWQATAGDNITATPAIGSDGSVYVGSTDRVFYAFAADGSLRWTVTTGGLIDSCSAAIAADGTVIFGSNDGKLYAVAPDGTAKWTRELVPGSTSTAAAYSPAIAADGTIYARASDGYLRALNSTDGSEKWRFNLNIAGNTGFYGNPVIGPDGTIYQGSDENDKKLYAINPDGTEKWRATLNSGVYGPPAVDGSGNVYLVTLQGGVYCFTPSGAPRWPSQISIGNVSSGIALSADGSTFYYADYEAKLQARSTATGAQRWAFTLGDEVRASSPAVDGNGVIYIGCYDGRLYAVNPDGTANRVYDTGDWIRSSPVISGTRLYVGSNDQKVYAFDLPAGASSGTWSQYRANARHTGRAESEVFAMATQPKSQTVVLGFGTTLTASATGAGPFTYQWQKDGAAIEGATSASYTIGAATAATAGTYTVVITGPKGSLTSSGAVITVEPPLPGRLVNVSVRTNAGSGANTLIVGFAVNGSGAKPLLIRGVGPTLTSYSVAGALAAPELRVVIPATDTTVASNSGWADSATLSATFDRVYAFRLLPGSKDAALVADLPAQQQYTAQITGANGTTGMALAEVYDLDPLAGTPAATLVNVSARAQVGTGGDVLIAGFVVSGNVKKKLLIRGVGPTLANYSVTGELADPKLEVYAGQTLQTSNDDWGGSPAMAAAFQQVYAFPLPATSRDAALLVELAPGEYTAQVSGVNSTTGVALIEVYVVE